jgi:hypothetical protein
MKRSLNLIVPEEVAQQLEHLAEREFRRPRDEAALLLVQAVRRAALDLLLRDEGDTEPSVDKPDRAPPASDTAPGTDALECAG